MADVGIARNGEQVRCNSPRSSLTSNLRPSVPQNILSLLAGLIPHFYLSPGRDRSEVRVHSLPHYFHLIEYSSSTIITLFMLTMRRRGPPTSLRLFQGPLPPRSQPKHTLPSVPRPVFQLEGSLPWGPSPAPRTRQANTDYLIFPDLPPLSSPELAAICRPSSNGNSTPSSSPTWSPTKRVRGPWDDSSCFNFVVDVDSILAPPKPVAAGV